MCISIINKLKFNSSKIPSYGPKYTIPNKNAKSKVRTKPMLV